MNLLGNHRIKINQTWLWWCVLYQSCNRWPSLLEIFVYQTHTFLNFKIDWAIAVFYKYVFTKLNVCVFLFFLNFIWFLKLLCKIYYNHNFSNWTHYKGIFHASNPAFSKFPKIPRLLRPWLSNLTKNRKSMYKQPNGEKETDKK